MLVQPALRRWLGAALILAAVAAGCSRSTDDDSGPQATVPRASTTTTISVAEVAEKIDVAYAQAVMDALDQVTGDAVRFFVAARGPSMDFYKRLKAAWDEPGFEEVQADYGRIAAREMERIRAQPRNPETKVNRIRDASPHCIVLEVTRTFENVFTEPPPPGTLDGYVQLFDKKPERDPEQLNPTPWVIVKDVHVEGAAMTDDPCRG